MLRRLLNEEIGKVGKRNITADKKFSEMLQRSLSAYRNRSIDAAEVIAELVELAKHLQAEGDRGSKLKMDTAELAFYDAVRTNDTAVLEMGDDTLQIIARKLVKAIRENASLDWNNKETVRAKLRSAVRRLLVVHKYPPDQQDATIDLVLQQAEVLATDWTAA